MKALLLALLCVSAAHADTLTVCHPGVCEIYDGTIHSVSYAPAGASSVGLFVVVYTINYESLFVDGFDNIEPYGSWTITIDNPPIVLHERCQLTALSTGIISLRCD